jgi:hypothetical protein
MEFPRADGAIRGGFEKFSADEIAPPSRPKRYSLCHWAPDNEHETYGRTPGERERVLWTVRSRSLAPFRFYESVVASLDGNRDHCGVGVAT